MTDPDTSRSDESTGIEIDVDIEGEVPNVSSEFDRFIAYVAERNRDRDGSHPRFVANGVVVGAEYFENSSEQGYLLQLTHPDYLGTGERVWPGEVLAEGLHESDLVAHPYPHRSSTDDPSLRELAVDVLTEALTTYYDRCPDGWLQFDPDTDEIVGEINRTGQ